MVTHQINPFVPADVEGRNELNDSGMDPDRPSAKLSAADELASKGEESSGSDVRVHLADDLEQLVGGVDIEADEDLGLGDDVVDSKVVGHFEVVLQLKAWASIFI